MIILKPPESPEQIFEVSGVAGTDFHGLWARWNRFSMSLGSPEPIFEVSRVARVDFWGRNVGIASERFRQTNEADNNVIFMLLHIRRVVK
jgi:hypothetical protein